MLRIASLALLILLLGIMASTIASTPLSVQIVYRLDEDYTLHVLIVTKVNTSYVFVPFNDQLIEESITAFDENGSPVFVSFNGTGFEIILPGIELENATTTVYIDAILNQSYFVEPNVLKIVLKPTYEAYLYLPKNIAILSIEPSTGWDLRSTPDGKLYFVLQPGSYTLYLYVATITTSTMTPTTTTPSTIATTTTYTTITTTISTITQATQSTPRITLTPTQPTQAPNTTTTTITASIPSLNTSTRPTQSRSTSTIPHTESSTTKTSSYAITTVTTRKTTISTHTSPTTSISTTTSVSEEGSTNPVLYIAIGMIIGAIAGALAAILKRRSTSSHSSSAFYPSTRPPTANLDERDLAILRLVNEGVNTISELARRLGLSKSTVWRRVHRLIESGFLSYVQAEGRNILRVTEAGKRILNSSTSG